MSEQVYNEEALAFYGPKVNQLIPLHVWSFVDARGAERGKSPRDKDWRTKLYEFSEIQNAIHSGHNIGFRLSERDLIVDMDPRNMETSLQDALSELEKTYQIPVEAAPKVKTGGGGMHIYLQLPESWVGKAFRNELPEMPGVEFKAHGRQVVAAGSKHPHGEMYIAEGGLTSPVAASEVLLEAIERPSISTRVEGRVLTNDELAELLEVLNVYDFDSNDDWVQLAMSCHAATQGQGLEAFVEWSTSDEKYSHDHEIIKNRWESFQGSGITSATLYRHIIDAGRADLLRPPVTDAFAAKPLTDEEKEIVEGNATVNPLFDRARDGRPKRTVDNVMRAIVELGVIPRRNELDQQNFIEGKRDALTAQFPTVSTAVNDDLLHTLRSVILKEYKFEPTLNQVSEALSALALMRPFHPIRNYLESLVWDGVDRISQFFARYCGTMNTPYVSAVGETMLKAAVGRVYRPGIKFDTMVILEGEQGCGKSTMLQILGGEWALEGLPQKADLNHKDVIQTIQGKWIVEVEELAVLRKSDVDSLKAFLTRTVDKARFAYAREAREYPRQCIFIGTTNDDEYLLDSTGNRRFLPVDVSMIDLNLLREDRDQIWAQAYQLWKMNPTPEGLMLPQSLWEDAREQQTQRRVKDPLEFKLEGFFKSTELDFIPTEQLLVEVIGKVPSEAQMSDLRRLSRAVQAIPGWRNCRQVIEGESVKGVEREKR